MLGPVTLITLLILACHCLSGPEIKKIVSNTPLVTKIDIKNINVNNTGFVPMNGTLSLLVSDDKLYLFNSVNQTVTKLDNPIIKYTPELRNHCFSWENKSYIIDSNNNYIYIFDGKDVVKNEINIPCKTEYVVNVCQGHLYLVCAEVDKLISVYKSFVNDIKFNHVASFEADTKNFSGLTFEQGNLIIYPFGENVLGFKPLSKKVWKVAETVPTSSFVRLLFGESAVYFEPIDNDNSKIISLDDYYWQLTVLNIQSPISVVSMLSENVKSSSSNGLLCLLYENEIKCYDNAKYYSGNGPIVTNGETTRLVMGMSLFAAMIFLILDGVFLIMFLKGKFKQD